MTASSVLAKIIYLNHEIIIDLPESAHEENTVKVLINRLPGTYDESEYNAYLDHFQFNGGKDPNTWVLEGFEAATKIISRYGNPYFEPLSDSLVENSEEYDNIPF